LSQSQILLSTPISLAPAAPPAMSVSTSANSHHSNNTQDPILPTHLTPLPPPTPSRPRSLSVSGLRTRNASSWSHSPRPLAPILNTVPRPGNPRHPVQWEGCGAYFCPSARFQGDNRPRCQEIIRECEDCRVLVCNASPPLIISVICIPSFANIRLI
jgi:hypothetical protein